MLSNTEIRDVAVKLAATIFDGVTADKNLDDLKAVIQKIDQGMDSSTNQVSNLYPNQKLKLALLDHARSANAALTVYEAAVALAYWALREAGL